MPLLRGAAERLGVPLARASLDKFARYHDLLVEHGSRFNLTSVLDTEGIQLRHFAESLAVGVTLMGAGRFSGCETIIDVGSGAGFPGIPLRIAWPELRLTLLEATGKKARFLQTVVDELELAGTRIIAARAEDAGRDPALREAFDLAVARAVAPLPGLAELTLPFVRVGGALAAVKGSRLPVELAGARAAIDRYGGGEPNVLPLPSEATGSPPRLLIIPKRRHTPSPSRAPGVPAARPLR